MREKLVENWLDSATERTFQLPFCHMLVAQGHRIVHVTRHWEGELGKDVISIAPSGTVCAYQLKTARGPRIRLSDWQGGMAQQTETLVTTRVDHPSIPKRRHHRSFLVTNRLLEESVSAAIERRNEAWAAQGIPRFRLDVWERGWLLKHALELESRLWPTELANERMLLELFLLTGREPLPKSKLAALLEPVLCLTEGSKKPSHADARRRAASAALLCALATASFAANRPAFNVEVQQSVRQPLSVFCSRGTSWVGC